MIATETCPLWTGLLPCALAGEYNLLLVEYTPWQQHQSAAWLPFVVRLAAEFAALHYYVLSIRYHAAPVTAGGTTSDCDNQMNLKLFLVRRNGAILWSEQGEWSPAKADALDDLLLALLPLTDAFV